MYRQICVTSVQRGKVSSLNAETGEVVGEVILNRLQRLTGIDYNPKLERLVVAGWTKLEEIDLGGKTTCVMENPSFIDIQTVLYTSDDTFLVSCARGADCVIEIDRRGKELFRWGAGDLYGDNLHLNSATQTKDGFLISLGKKKKIVEISRDGEILNEIDVSFVKDVHHGGSLYNPILRDGEIWFSGGNAVYVINEEGKVLDKFEEGFLNPLGLDFWGSKVLVAENHAHRVSIMDSGKVTKFAVNPYPFRAVWVKETFFPGG